MLYYCCTGFTLKANSKHVKVTMAFNEIGRPAPCVKYEWFDITTVEAQFCGLTKELRIHSQQYFTPFGSFYSSIKEMPLLVETMFSMIRTISRQTSLSLKNHHPFVPSDLCAPFRRIPVSLSPCKTPTHPASLNYGHLDNERQMKVFC